MRIYVLVVYYSVSLVPNLDMYSEWMLNGCNVSQLLNSQVLGEASHPMAFYTKQLQKEATVEWHLEMVVQS